MILSRLTRGNAAACALVAVLVILVGYADLWRGGTEVAAAALAIGYVIMVPVAILAYGIGRNGEASVEASNTKGASASTARSASSVASDSLDAESPPYRWAALVGLVVFALYVITLAPTTAMWDTSEYIAAAKILGIPHPPGNPIFVIVAHAFAMLPIPVSYAERVNLLAACTSAISAALWFLVTWRCLRGAGFTRAPRIVAAAIAAWIGATAFTVWNQSVVNEKVYTLALLGLAVSAWAALRWFDAPKHSRRADSILLLIAYLCGLGYANHPAGFLPLPAFGLFVLVQRPSTLLRWRLLIVSALMLAAGLTAFIFQPVRAAYHPAINVGEPTACAGTPQFGCTFSTETFNRVMSNVSRDQYGGHTVMTRQVEFGGQVGMWWYYFKWQWLRDAYREHQSLQSALAVLFFALGLLGAVRHFKQDRPTFTFVAALVFTVTPLLIFYLNFRYGATQSPELGDSVLREVRDRDYFFIWSFSTWGIWTGIGLAWIWRALASLFARGTTTAAGATLPARALQLASPVLLLAFIPVFTNYTQASRHGQTFTSEWARDLLQSVEPYGILITSGDNDSFPIWYAQNVEGVRTDVTVALIPYLPIEWYMRSLVRARPTEYDGSGIPAYKALAGPKPTKSIMALSLDEVTQMPQYLEVREPSRFQHAGIDIVIPQGVVPRDHLVVYQFIKDAFPQRPVYFAIGNYAEELGLGEYVVTQGLAQRLLDHPARTDTSYVQFPGGFLDVPRSVALWESYRAPAALLAHPGWIDEPSNIIPSAYAWTAQLIAAGLKQKGDEAKAKELTKDMQRIAAAAHLLH